MAPYLEAHERLLTIHRAIFGSLRAVGTGTTIEVVAPQAMRAGRFLLGHHESEDTILFAGLRRMGRLRSTDVAFLDGCDRAHHELHALCERLVEAAGASHPDREKIVRLAEETIDVLAAHVADEETGLAPERLREMIDEEGLLEIARESESRRVSRMH